MTNDNKTSPSAFIPFCEFGGDMSGVGAKLDQFDDPVCNSFQAKILNDQLCYEVDLNRFSSKNNINKELESGFAFIMDYNEDRQVTFNKDHEKTENEGLVERIIKSDEEQNSYIYFDTIGKKHKCKQHFESYVVQFKNQYILLERGNTISMT